MSILLEIFLFLGIYFPLFHILNIIFIRKNKNNININDYKKISILIPCYNEEKIIKNTIDGLLRINYKNYECLFINDGSNDNTFKEFKKILNLRKINRKKIHNIDSKKVINIYKSKRYSNIYVIDKENGGKSDALNIGINYAKYDYIATLDADSILQVDALKLIIGAFNNPNVIAASGIIQILQSFNLSEKNHKTTLKINNILKLQTIEYIKSCFIYKASLAKLKSLLVISGAFGVFKKDILLKVGGYNNVLGEDLDITIKIQLLIKDTDNIIAYVPEAICYTEGPETYRDFFKQRERWQKSFIESLFNYKHIIFRESFTKSIAFFMIIDALFIGTISSIIILAFLPTVFNTIINNNLSHIIIYFLLFISVHLIYNITGLLIAWKYNVRYHKLDILRLIFSIILDIFYYRLIILYTIVKGTISYFISDKSWNKVNRSGRNYNVLKKD